MKSYSLATATITMALSDYEEMKQDMELMKKALDDKSVVIGRYYGYQYHIINADEKMKELVDKINKHGIKFI